MTVELKTLQGWFPTRTFADVTADCKTIDGYVRYAEEARVKPAFVYVLRLDPITQGMWPFLLKCLEAHGKADVIMLSGEDYLFVESKTVNWRPVLSKFLLADLKNRECQICKEVKDDKEVLLTCSNCGEQICNKCVASIVVRTVRVPGPLIYACPFCKKQGIVTARV